MELSGKKLKIPRTYVEAAKGKEVTTLENDVFLHIFH